MNYSEYTPCEWSGHTYEFVPSEEAVNGQAHNWCSTCGETYDVDEEDEDKETSND